MYRGLNKINYFFFEFNILKYVSFIKTNVRLFSTRKIKKLIKKNIFCLWITGISGAGKTTLANNTKEHLTSLGYNVVVLDGDDVRSTINSDLSFNMKGRDENIRRIAQLAKLLAKQNIVSIVSVISPMESQRKLAHKVFEKNLHLIYLKASIERCIQNDNKGLYKKARENTIKNFTGITSPYEEPTNPNLEINTDTNDAEKAAKILYEYIEKMTKS